jgi:hypothetical protein
MTYKGLDVYIIIGFCRPAFGNISPTVPPATLRNADPANPPKNRATTSVVMFFASAQGMIQIAKINVDTTYMGLRP